MSKIYDKYFAEKDFYDSIADLMYDIRSNRIHHKDVIDLANELYEKKLIPNDSMFSKEEDSKWDKQYVNYLMNGAGAGKLSKEYLIYYSKVATKVHKRKQNLIAASVCGGVLIIACIIKFAFLTK